MAPRPVYETHTFAIPAFKVDKVLDRLKTLSNKAVSLGMPQFSIDCSDPVIRAVPGDRNRFAKYQDVTVTGGAPVIAGWRFVAKIEHDDMMNMVQGFGAQDAIDANPDLFDRLSNCPPNCEHCKIKRDRNITFLFSSESDPDKTIQVGSTCVADFSGHKDPALVLSVATGWQTILNEVTDPDYLGSEKLGPSFWEFERIIAAAAAAVRQDGHWISRDAADPLQISTADTVEYLLGKPGVYERVVRQQDLQRAQEAVEWLTSDIFDPKGQVYLHNLRALCHRKFVGAKNIGLAASTIAAFKMESQRQQNRAAERESLANVKVGEVGKKIDLDVVVEKIIPIETQFGISRLHLMKDLESNARLTWFNSGSRKFFEGDTYRITGRIKKHEQRDEIWQTQLTRVNSPDIKLQDAIDKAGTNSRYIQGDDVKKLTKKLSELVHKDARNGEGQTVLFTASRAYCYGGEVFRDLVKQCLRDGHAPDIQDDREGQTPFDYLVATEDEELIKQALELCPELGEGWSTRKLDSYEIESSRVRSLLTSGQTDNHGVSDEDMDEPSTDGYTLRMA